MSAATVTGYIAVHQAAFSTYRCKLARSARMHSTATSALVAEAETAAAHTKHDHAWAEVLVSRPESLAELATLALHLRDVVAEMDPMADCEAAHAFRGLCGAVLALAGKEGAL